MARLQDRVVVVTGAAQGLGRAIALKLGQEGARLALLDLQAEAVAETATLVQAAGGQAVALHGDVTDEAMVADLFGRIHAHYGQVDVLVNNVGGSRNMKIWEMTAEAWDYTIRLNLRSAFLCTRAVLPGMMARRSGNIICLSSGAREGTPWSAEDQGAAAYSTCKAGIHGFIRDLCWELSPYGIRTNAVAPGPIATDKNAPIFAAQEARLVHPPSRMLPMVRLGQAHEIADAVCFLASDESSYITGVTLDVAGGR